MGNGVAALDRGFYVRLIGNAAGSPVQLGRHRLASDSLDKGEVRSVVQHTNLVAGARQPPDDPGSQESASASNEIPQHRRQVA